MAIAVDHQNMTLLLKSVQFAADIAFEMNYYEESFFFYNECRKLSKRAGNLKI